VLTGPFARDVLVADCSNALLVNSGGIVKTYVLPGNGGGDFALNLDSRGYFVLDRGLHYRQYLGS
jgi:hypothetical protein